MSPGHVDLDADSRLALDFDGVLAAVAGHARTAMGRDGILDLFLFADAAGAMAETATVSESWRQLEREGSLIPTGLADPRPMLAGLAVQGVTLEARALRDLAASVLAASELGRRLAALDPADFPRLYEMAPGIPDLAREADPILAGIDGEGRLLDAASPELARLRRARARLAERLRRLLERMVREPGRDDGIRDDFVTQRNGRFVVPVRTDAPHALRGIVHATSASGATRFVEPLETVEPNNELVRLEEQELEEERRLLALWSDGFRRRATEVDRSLAGLARVDALEARARYGAELKGTAAEIVSGGPIRVRGLRHPLLERRLREHGGSAVPLDLDFDPADRALVLSGPNTGGKTVAAKSLGLAVLSAHAGIPVAADSASLPLYRQVRADIGDHQSIASDLSTFSAHVRAISRCIADVRQPALLLFDELGTGTEPSEGAALAQAVLEALLRPGVTTVATTHLAAIKAWAFTTPGAASAAMELNSTTLEPTYRVQMGAAGTSAALAIAVRLGLDPRIVARARECLGPQAIEAETYLVRLRESLAALEGERAQIAERTQQIEDERTRWTLRLDLEEQRRRDGAAAALERALVDLRREGRRELDQIVDKREQARAERRLAAAESRIAGEKRRHQAEIAPGTAEGSQRDWREPSALEAGQAVWVGSIGREGIVVEARGEQVDVRLGALRLTVRRDDLRVAPAGQTADEPPGVSARIAGRTRPDDRDETTQREINLIGRRVEEALVLLDRFLDASVLAGHDEIRVIHGHGTGRLREALRRHLDGHPQVRAARPAGPEAGGDGATVVELR